MRSYSTGDELRTPTETFHAGTGRCVALSPWRRCVIVVGARKRAIRLGVVRDCARDLAASDGMGARELSLVLREWPRRQCSLLLLLLDHGVEEVVESKGSGAVTIRLPEHGRRRAMAICDGAP
jgi:hypothetical protein